MAPTYWLRGKVRALPRLLCLTVSAGLLFLGALPASAQTKSAGKTATTTQKKKPASKSSKARKSSTRSRRSRGQSAPAAERIREIQTALGRAGFLTGEPNGKWDAATTTAMKNFQESKGLRASGKLDAVTLQGLGLGSSVAGVAPPRPAATASPSSER